MSRDKQIEEMVMVLTESQHAFDRAWKECLHNNAPMPDRENVFYAKYLVEKEGYLKASDVAREIIDDLESRILLSGNGLYSFPVITHEFIAELKKKYESEKDE